MRKLLIGAALLSTALATPAFAQEDAPFTGPHVEALVGYDDVADGDGDLMYGVAAGYDFQMGGVIAGIEGEFADSDVNGAANDLFSTGDSFRLNTDRDLYVGARLGFAVSPSTMIYVKGGYTNAKFEGRFDNGAGTIFNNGVTADGYRVGAGMEQKFNLLGPSGFIKAEYRYSNYKNLDIGENDYDRQINVDRHQAVIGLGVRF
ncbi:outer membrane protein [Sphingorhabdus wooponensis]|uniref:Porin family protein n=1 Tax=Sphingorhabdus wooponensis TaxID=940136 RepID=A0A3R8R3G1_9SPHN|nr:outer membrane beta-barrel protein [Sphingorhabdus wooponensis]RRQ51062.1 porin family protein [Sphingorhabdus wooponensis]